MDEKRRLTDAQLDAIRSDKEPFGALSERRRSAHMRRRDFITLLGSGAVVWPLAANAQQPPMPVIGYLYLGAAEPSTHLVAAFRKGLSEMGYVEGRNVSIEFR